MPEPSATASFASLPVNPVLSAVTRSGRLESFHRGSVVVVHDGEIVLQLGSGDEPVYARSVVKPLQALPLYERGVVERLGLTAAERAVLCASHDGTPAHTATVSRFLARGGFDEDLLGCGPHAPFAKEARLAMLRDGERPRKLHNNCSGKHTGFLHLARELGVPLAEYLDPASASQQLVQQAVAEMAGLDAPLPIGVDGCGAPTFQLPLAAMARAFCQLANPDGPSCVRTRACRSILEAVGQAPVLLAGEARLCTALVRCWPGRAFAKNGAEGVYAVALAPDATRDRYPGALGVAIKADDGAERGYQPVVVDLLRWLGAFAGCQPETVPPDLQRFWRLAIGNTQKKVVGDVHCVVPWSEFA
ncbi:MAG: asparaginase [Planctomycetota bacterium]